MRIAFKLIFFLISLSTVLCCSTLNAKKTTPVLSPKAISALDSPKKNIRIAGIASLAKSKSKKARPYLEKMLHDKEATVRASALDALGKIGDPRALKSLYSMHNDKSKLVKRFLKKNITILEKIRKKSQLNIHFYYSQVDDISGRLPEVLKQQMQNEISTIVSKSKAFKSQTFLSKNSKFTDLNSDEDGYAIHLETSNIKKERQGAVNVITVKCKIMILKHPEQSLRLQSSATAGAGIEGSIDKEMRAELLQEGIHQCSASLAQDIIDFTIERRKKMGTL